MKRTREVAKFTMAMMLALALTMQPFMALAQTTEHQHDETCGYARDAPCQHVHDEDEVTCEHQHDDTCGYVAGAACTWQAGEDSGTLSGMDEGTVVNAKGETGEVYSIRFNTKAFYYETHHDIPGVPVDLYKSDDTFIGTMVSDEQGYCTFTDLPPGKYTFRVAAGTYNNMYFDAFEFTDLELSNDESLVPVFLDRNSQPGTFSIQGTVNTDTGDGDYKAEVELFDSNKVLIESTATSQSGGYRIYDVPPGIYTVVIPGHYFSYVFYKRASKITYISDQNITVSFDLERGSAYVIEGIIQNNLGQLVSDVLVQLFLNDECIGESTSNNEGEYSFANLEPGEYTLTVPDGNYGGVNYTGVSIEVSIVDKNKNMLLPIKRKPATIPDAPTNLTATPGDESLEITWSKPTNEGNSAITKYQVSVSAGEDNWQDYTISGAEESFSMTKTGLTNGATYYVKVRAVNAVGESAAASTTGIPETSATEPDAPTNLAAIPGDGELTLTWTKPANDGGSAITSYEISVSTGEDAWEEIPLSQANTTSTTRKNLINGATYTVKLRAVNKMGAGAEVTTTGTPVAATVPDAPTDFTATPGDGQVVLSWTAPANNGGKDITKYEVSSDDGATWTDASDTEHTFSNLTNGTSYTFKVRAVNEKGVSLAASKTAKPVAPPTDVTYTATQSGGTSATADSTSIAITFDKAVSNLAAENITITGATRGALSGNGTAWAIGISDITVGNGGNVTIEIADFDTFVVGTDKTDVEVFKQLVKAATPTAYLDGSDMALWEVSSEMKHSLDGGQTYNEIHANPIYLESDLLFNRINTTDGIRVIQKGDGINTLDSDVQIIALTKAATPTGVGKTDETAQGNDATLTGVDTNMEYKDNPYTSHWLPITDTTVTGLAAGTYEVRTKGSKNTLPSDAVQVVIIVSGAQAPKLKSIAQPGAITGIANGTAKTAAALGLPSTVAITTTDASITSANVTWNVVACIYEATVTTEQTFAVKGTVTLPAGLENTDGIGLAISINVTVNAADHTHSFGSGWMSDGSHHWHECDCGAKGSNAIHVENDGVETTPATETSTGTRTFSCKTCDKVLRTEEIAMLHTHSYSTDWSTDADNHWQVCTTCDEKGSSAAHDEKTVVDTKAATEDEEGERTYSCSVCAKVMRTETIPKLTSTHTHSYSSTWSYDADYHWQACACGAQINKSKHRMFFDALRGRYICICGLDESIYESHEEHVVSTNWSHDTNYHWQECSCGAQINKYTHIFLPRPVHDEYGGVLYWCDCGFQYYVNPHEGHDVSTNWSYDTENHWRECSCGEQLNKGGHYLIGSGLFKICTCGYLVRDPSFYNEHTHIFDPDWSSDANSHWHECKIEGCAERNDLAAHTSDDGTVTKKPTASTPGQRTYRCKVCERVLRTEEIPAVKKGWVQKVINGELVWVFNNIGEDGLATLQTGWLLWNDQWFYFDENGIMQIGWVQMMYKGKLTWFKLGKKGAMEKGWHKENGKWYFHDNNGAMLTGWHMYKGKWYYQDANGAMVTGWVKINHNGVDTWFYFGESGPDEGVMQTGWVFWEGNWYYLNEDGSMATGWVEWEGNQYYLDANGKMLTGWHWVRYNGQRMECYFEPGIGKSIPQGAMHEGSQRGVGEPRKFIPNEDLYL